MNSLKRWVYCALLISCSAKAELVSIGFYSNDMARPLSGYLFEAPFKPATKSYLDLGDELAEQFIKLAAADNDQFRLFAQYETSVTVMDEGPHLDLTDWKHCTTDWIPVDQITPATFQFPASLAVDLGCFPEVSGKELKKAVSEYGGERWSSLLGADVSPNSYPLATSLNTIRLRVEQLKNGEWVAVTMLDIAVPMGC